MAEVTLGGDRVGSGNKQKIYLDGYKMTSFNLEQDWKSSMAPGILYPFLKLVGTNHGTFDIDLDSFVRTIPTKGPLFGSFKLQLDIYNVPIRLYQGILHNNPVGIGLKMNQVYLPKIQYVTAAGSNTERPKGSDNYNWQVNDSSLLKYMGISGAGYPADYGVNPNASVRRKFNAIPFLAYYDIFKCYYANKQEENAYVIVPGNVVDTIEYDVAQSFARTLNGTTGVYTQHTFTKDGSGNIYIDLEGTTEVNNNMQFNIFGDNLSDNVPLGITDNTTEVDIWDGTIGEALENNYIKWFGPASPDESKQRSYQITALGMQLITGSAGYQTTDEIEFVFGTGQAKADSEITLQPFKLENIDTMRNRLLSANTLGAEFVINNETNLLPYSALVNTTNNGISWNAFIDNGLCVKTYQSDLFNNWLNTDWIDGENGISALTAVTVTDGTFTIDSLNLAEKIYEVLNRVAVSGGTYEDWQEAVYGEGAVRKAETPMYCGGMSAEIMFEEVISTAETSVNEDYQPLGSLGGRGAQVGKKGGNNIHIKCEEPCYIIGIASLTPRIAYSQGNDWDMTELDTLDDLHKPALDGIGFQDLMVEQFAWWDTQLIPEGNSYFHRSSAGKQTAWINYQTAVDKTYGDFARSGGYAFMALNRNYEIGANVHTVKDVTTYIDPRKFNYAFAYTDLAAQNFWCQIHSKVVARRKMGAQQIPNL